jgi:hypothetical protein
MGDGGFHGTVIFRVGVKLSGGDGSIGCTKMGEECECRDIAVSGKFMFACTNVGIINGSENWIMKGLVNFMVMLESTLVVTVLMDILTDLELHGIKRKYGVETWVGRQHECLASNGKVLGETDGEDDMAKLVISTTGVDGCGVAVKCTGRDKDGGICWALMIG